MANPAGTRGQVTRARLLSAALESFASRGYHGTTTALLAERTGIAEGTIYRHYPGKDDLYAAVALQAWEQVTAALLEEAASRSSARERLAHALVHGETVRKHRRERERGDLGRELHGRSPRLPRLDDAIHEPHALRLVRRIDWIPAGVRDGLMGHWLEGARDWAISRNRFWGTPIPVWKSDDPRYPRVDVYGSLDELERDFGVRPTDLHRPAIDQLVRRNPDDPTGKSTMRRVPEVLDCWFESGSMPFAQVHYPFENKDWFDHHFPADFIVEYIAQTRGWFYTLHVLATALFDSHPFENVVCHGILLAEGVRKMLSAFLPGWA